MAKIFNLQTRLTLSDGTAIPRLGLGVYESNAGPETYNAVKWALEAGYRHIDSAKWYENEKDCGQAINDFIKESGVKREEIFYTTKLMENGSQEHVLKAVKTSLAVAGLDYIDCYLMHSPLGGEATRRESWLGCIQARKLGLVRSIGVSNFGVRHLEQLLATKPEFVPVLNQIDLHPFMAHNDIVSFCEQHQIALEAWAPLVRGKRFNDATIQALAKKYNKSPAQILVRYGIDRNFIVIPKSVKKERIVENADVFDFALTQDEVEQLRKLDEYLVTDWDVVEEP